MNYLANSIILHRFMHIIKVLPAVLTIIICHIAQAQSAQNKWKLVWTEDFNGKHLDTTRWNYIIDGGGGGNNELEYYTARDTNSYLKGGMLHIRGLKEEYAGHHYTSARLTT